MEGHQEEKSKLGKGTQMRQAASNQAKKPSQRIHRWNRENLPNLYGSDYYDIKINGTGNKRRKSLWNLYVLKDITNRMKGQSRVGSKYLQILYVALGPKAHERGEREEEEREWIISKCWWGCGQIGDLLHCEHEYKMWLLLSVTPQKAKEWINI